MKKSTTTDSKPPYHEMSKGEFYQDHVVVWGYLILGYIIADAACLTIIYFLFK